MYINELDKIFDNILDKFYKYLKKENISTKIIKDPNFVKYQNIIMQTLENFMKTLDLNKINKIVNNKTNYNKIKDIIKRYIAYYIILDLAYNYKAGRNLFITNMIELSKNQKMISFQINNFFNSENNAKIINFFTIIKNIQILQNAKTMDKIKILLLNNPIYYNSVIKLFNSVGENYIIEYFLIKDNKHNIIKTLIFKELYMKEEKKDVFRILNYNEETQGEYRYINITVASKDKMIDYNTIENILTIDQKKSELANEIYNYLLDYKNNTVHTKKNNDKINILLENNTIIPITEEFMRYHDDKLSYKSEDEFKKKFIDNTKIKEIINKIVSVVNYNSVNILNKPKLKKKIKEEIFDKNLNYKEAILYNDLEELKIIKKVINSNILKENDYLTDLLNYRKYNYINYKDFSKSGIKVRLKKNIQTLRSVNITNKIPRNNLELRVNNNKLHMNMIGIAFNLSKNTLECFKKNDLINIKTKFDNKNGYEALIKLIDTYKKNKLNKNKIYYWIFNDKTDKPLLNNYQNVSSLNKNENFKIILADLYDKWIELMYEQFIQNISKHDNLTFNKIKQLFKYYENNNFDFNNELKLKSKIKTEFILKYLPELKLTIDEIENKIPGKGTNIIKLPIYKNEKQKKNIVVLKENNDAIIQNITTIPSICNHYIKWINILKTNKSDIDKFNEKIFNFVKQYVKVNNNGEYICKSCSEYLAIKKYVYEGTYVKEMDTFMTTNIAIRDGLTHIKKYQKLQRSIKNINKIIEKVANLANLNHLIGNDPIIKLRRDMIIKDTMDLLLLHTKYIKEQGSNRLNSIKKKYNIDKNYTNLFFFDLKDEIFITSSDDTDYYKIIKYNNIIAYLLFIIITELNAGQILNLKDDKRCNYFFYDKWGKKLFEGLYLRMNKKDVIEITKLDLLCYVIFYFSCLFIKNKIWLWKSTDDKFNANIQKSIIYTVIDLMNSIIEANLKEEKKLLYEIITTRLYIKIKTMYNSPDIIGKLKKIIYNRIKINKDTKKMIYISKKFTLINLTGERTQYNLVEYKNPYCNSEITQLDKIKTIHQDDINILTNCANGEFHKWTINNDLICLKCNKKYKDLLNNYSDSDINYIDTTIKKLIYINLNKLAIKHCLKGDGEQYGISTNSCKKVINNEKNWVFDDKELKNFYKVITTNKTKINYNEIEKLRNKIKSNKNKTIHINNIINDLNKEYTKSINNNLLDYINSFIKFLINIVGETIMIDDNKIPLLNSVFEINHDHYGGKTKSIYYINDTSNNIIIKNNHPFFKIDVLYYINKQKNITLYYDKITYQYLGYSKKNKEYIKVRSNINLKKIYSIRDMLLYLGFKNEYTYIIHLNLKYKNMDINKINSNDVYNTIYTNRIHNLTNIILRVQSLIQQLIYKKNTNNKILNKFKNKIKKIKTINENTNINIFDNWYIITNILINDKIKTNITKPLNKYASNKYLNYLLGNDVKLIYYLISELLKLLKYNKKSNFYAEIANFIINIIYNIHNKYYIPLNHIDLTRFNYLLINETPYLDESLKVIGYYNELINTNELDEDAMKQNEYNANEELSSLDIDDNDSDNDFYFEEGDGSYFD